MLKIVFSRARRAVRGRFAAIGSLHPFAMRAWHANRMAGE
ncbi:DNA-directed RNA polymerase, beta' subunit [Burkholderia pseudomallei 406e]|uniref:Uncharacterized protein n=2 Tax=Burkholderia pseudomallei TaxID=28450 RepID=A0A0E1W5H2_BURPE|nr:hypothetical protein BURPS668_3806 [Burkholderia pseudomallei 668]ABN91280.1 hypothetical protein BURPS1106A_3866 [Burkholderia pseudomallei 1106a]EDO85646.1 DNA-directed RNA polymerase, beta' subunit [Burkholderia pseudomallei 406e]EEH30615.1 conserved hypothetical protein [Burkholderia pseudomallei Pakistan 9]EES27583.1 hypothetical protein BURPS1106B_A3072 [Burkholderia pseudomallei 1106b]EET07669.1 hypothetical protein BURPS1710A_0062 [Burkholderia pseudomallei 1710a]MBG1252233.1 DNA-d